MIPVIKRFLHGVFRRKILISIIITIILMIFSSFKCFEEPIGGWDFYPLWYLILSYLTLFSFLVSIYFILERLLRAKAQRFHKFLRIFFIILGVLWLLAFSIILVFHQDSRIKMAFNQISRKKYRVDLPVCTLVVPKNWYSEVSSVFNGIDKHKLIYMDCQRLSSYKGKSVELAYTIFSFGVGRDEQAFLNTYMGKGITRLGPKERIIHNVDGKEVFSYHYQGTKRMDGDDKNPLYITTEEFDSVTIAVCSDFGFYGFFWGLPQHEPLFWDTLNSIEWKTLSKDDLTVE